MNSNWQLLNNQTYANNNGLKGGCGYQTRLLNDYDNTIETWKQWMKPLNYELYSKKYENNPTVWCFGKDANSQKNVFICNGCNGYVDFKNGSNCNKCGWHITFKNVDISSLQDLCVYWDQEYNIKNDYSWISQRVNIESSL